MSEFSPLELMLQEKLRTQWPGMPENDVQSMAASSATMGIYTLGPDSLEKEGIPKGQLIDYTILSAVVVLPAPVSPTRPRVSPGQRLRLTSSTAYTVASSVSYSTLRFFISNKLSIFTSLSS